MKFSAEWYQDLSLTANCITVKNDCTTCRLGYVTENERSVHQITIELW